MMHLRLSEHTIRKHSRKWGYVEFVTFVCGVRDLFICAITHVHSRTWGCGLILLLYLETNIQIYTCTCIYIHVYNIHTDLCPICVHIVHVQNIVSFIGLFCKTDLCCQHIYAYTCTIFTQICGVRVVWSKCRRHRIAHLTVQRAWTKRFYSWRDLVRGRCSLDARWQILFVGTVSLNAHLIVIYICIYREMTLFNGKPNRKIMVMSFAYFDRKVPPPRGGFLFTMFPDQEPGGRGLPLKNHSQNWSIPVKPIDSQIHWTELWVHKLIHSPKLID